MIYLKQWWLNSSTNPSDSLLSIDYHRRDYGKLKRMENFSSAVSLHCGSCHDLGVRVKFVWDQGAAVVVNTTVLLPIGKVSPRHFALGDRLRCSKPLENFPALPAKIETQTRLIATTEGPSKMLL